MAIWDPTTASQGVIAQPVLAMPFPTSSSHSVPSCLAFSPDGKYLAAGDFAGMVTIWDVRSRDVLHTFGVGEDGPVLGLAFSPDSKRLATAGGLLGQVWDVASGRKLVTLNGHTRQVSGVCYHPLGASLATSSFDNTVRLWDPETGAELNVLHGHNHYLQGVAFSPDGLRLADASHDMTLKIWDPSSRQDVLTLRGHTDPVTSVAFSPNGNYLASTSSTGLVLVWDATPKAASSEAAERRFPQLMPGQ
jgi:WD40 repeat protein